MVRRQGQGIPSRSAKKPDSLKWQVRKQKKLAYQKNSNNLLLSQYILVKNEFVLL